MTIYLTNEVKHLLNRLNLAGYFAWVVGGCVRDSLLSRGINDWDVCTIATPNQMEKALSGEKLIKTGLKHGTITVVINGVSIETTTLRADGDYRDHRRPDTVRFVSDIESDLARRDFTINSMAYNDSDGLIDPFNGQNDLKAKVIRSVGDPRKRFNEDSLRILRAVRFSSQLDFSIERDTKLAARDMSRDLDYVSRQRVLVEIIKTLEGKAAARAISENKEIVSSALGVEITDSGYKQLPRDWIVGMTLIAGHDALRVLNALKASNADKSRMEALCELLNYPVIATRRDAIKLMRRAKNEMAVKDICMYWQYRGIDFDKSLIASAKGECHSISGLSIDGNDLVGLGFTGKNVGVELERLLSLVVDGEIENERESLIKSARECMSASRHT